MKISKDYKSIFQSIGSSTQSNLDKYINIEREEYGLSLRKKKMNNYLMDKREKNLDINLVKKCPYEIQIEKLDISDELKNKQYNSPSLFTDEMKILLDSKNINEVKFAINKIRLLTITKDISIDYINEMYKRNITDKLMFVLYNYINDYEIIYEVTWIIINFVTKISNINLVVFLTQNTCFQMYIKILDLNNDYLTENILWLLYNSIINNNPIIENLFFSVIPRNYVVKYCENSEVKLNLIKLCVGILYNISSLLSKIHELFDINDLNNNFFKRHSEVSIDNIKENIYYLEEHISNIFIRFLETNDQDIIDNCLLGLTYLANISNKKIHQLLFSSGLIRKIITNKITYNKYLSQKILQLIGNFLSNFEEILDPIIQNEINLYLSNFIKSSGMFKRDALWSFSNFISCEKINLENIINSGIIPEIINSLIKDEIPISRECLFIIDAIVINQDFNIEIIINFIKNCNLIKLLINVIEKFYEDSESIIKILEIFLSLFEIGQKYSNLNEGKNCYLEEFKRCGGNTYIEKLQGYNNNEVYKLNESIINTFFNFDS